MRARVPDDTSAHCSYVRVEEQPPPAGAAPRPSGEAGGWYVYGCPEALYAIWIPDGRRGGVAPVSPAQLAMVAYRQLRLPAPRIRSNPVGSQLVNLPTWLWVEGLDWGPRSAVGDGIGAGSVGDGDRDPDAGGLDNGGWGRGDLRLGGDAVPPWGGPDQDLTGLWLYLPIRLAGPAGQCLPGGGHYVVVGELVGYRAARQSREPANVLDGGIRRGGIPERGQPLTTADG